MLELKIGSHVGMSGKEMMLASAKEAASYGANTFMAYTGAPQNTRRKEISELNIDKAWEYMGEHGIDNIVIHAPYIINLANTVKPETFQLAVEFLAVEIERTAAMRSNILVLHPGSHVGAGEEAGIAQIIKGLNEVLTADTVPYIAIETMAGKGSEIGRTFEEIAKIYEKEQFKILTKNEYIDIVIKQLEILNENVVIERITGDPIKEELITPQWLLKKFVILNDIDKEMKKRDTWQGKNFN